MVEQVVLTDASQVTAAWLTEVLKAKGALTNGCVGSVTAEPLPSDNSHMTRLHLRYENGAEGNLLASLMLKIVITQPGEFGSSEVNYYTRDYADLPSAPIPACYHAAYSPERHAYHLLLEDLTLVHGDPNPGNILTPINDDGPVYLVDRQPFEWSFTEWLGASDPAYMMVLWWEPELRRQLEMDVLRHYHARLRQRGVTSYTWEQLLDDYRLSVVQMVYVPIDWCVVDSDRERMKWLWLAQLHRVMTAVFELDCMELLVG